MKRTRATLIALATAGFLALLAIGYAAPRWGIPWRSAERLLLTPAEVSTQFADSEIQNNLLRLDGANEQGISLLRLTDSLDTDRYRFLTVHFPLFPILLKNGLSWTAEDGRREFVLLPFPDHELTVDLVRFPQWKGTIHDLSLIQLPADLLPSQAARRRTVAFASARFEGDGYAAAVAALLDEWSMYRPWNGRSINTEGLGVGYPDARGWTMPLVVAVLLVVLGIAWARRWPKRRVAQGLLAASAALWVILDLWQLRTLMQRASRTQVLAQTAGEEGLAAETGLAAALSELSRLIEQDHSRRDERVVVFGANPFLRTYPVFALLPLNAAAPTPTPGLRLPTGSIAVVLGAVESVGTGEDWIAIHGQRQSARTIYRKGPVIAMAVLAPDSPAGATASADDAEDFDE